LIAVDLGTRAFSLVRHKERYRTRASEAFEARLPSATEIDQSNAPASPAL
jgi:hypothetical protein